MSFSKGERISFKVALPSGRHYECTVRDPSLPLSSQMKEGTDILVASIFNPQHVVVQRECFPSQTVFSFVIDWLRVAPLKVPGGYVRLAMEQSKRSCTVFFNASVRASLGLPFRSMKFWTSPDPCEDVQAFTERLQSDLGLAPSDSRFRLFANCEGLGKVLDIPPHRAIEPLAEKSRNERAFLQFQFAEHNSHLAPAGRSGYLYVKKRVLFTQVLKKRWFTLRGGGLRWAHSPTDPKVQTITLGQGRVRVELIPAATEEPSDLQDEWHGIKVKISKESTWSRSKKLQLFAPTLAEIESWKQAFESATPADPLVKEHSTDFYREPEWGIPTAAATNSDFDLPSLSKLQIEAPQPVDSADTDSIFSLYTHYEPSLREEAPSDEDYEDQPLSICFVCSQPCMVPMRLDGCFNVHLECFVCEKCNDLPVDYVVICSESANIGGFDSQASFDNVPRSIVCRGCYQRCYCPKCELCSKDIVKGLLERRGKSFHAACYFNSSVLNVSD